MKLSSVLNETPLPSSWDKGVFTNRNYFKRRIEYAKERAKRLGGGSSRVAFEVKYKGRPTVLKIAKNKKGEAQNEAEVQLFEDWFLQDSGLIIPMIDYDEENVLPTWIHAEKAEKMTHNKFKRFFGFPFDDLNVVINIMRGEYEQIRWLDISEDEFYELMEENEFVEGLSHIVSNYDHIEFGDFSNLSNWGVYKNRPVIIDLGLTIEVHKLHYK